MTGIEMRIGRLAESDKTPADKMAAIQQAIGKIAEIKPEMAQALNALSPESQQSLDALMDKKGMSLADLTDLEDWKESGLIETVAEWAQAKDQAAKAELQCKILAEIENI